IFYTSGTTAFPKGVMLAHGQITRNMYEARVIREELTSDDRLLVVAPFVHIVGGMNSVFGMLHVGGCLVLQDRFDADGVLDVIGLLVGRRARARRHDGGAATRDDRDPRRRPRDGAPAAGGDAGRDRHPRVHGDEGLLRQADGDERGRQRGRLASHR
ncbi:MAG: AMP-binding protein, partial [Candidatus Rokubacteria bacterium]|nr:AMP-binding protein [Candidatus Rokubacteria bacterium]